MFSSLASTKFILNYFHQQLNTYYTIRYCLIFSYTFFIPLKICLEPRPTICNRLEKISATHIHWSVSLYTYRAPFHSQWTCTHCTQRRRPTDNAIVCILRKTNHQGKNGDTRGERRLADLVSFRLDAIITVYIARYKMIYNVDTVINKINIISAMDTLSLPRNCTAIVV